MENNNLLSQALQYRKSGLSIIPLLEGDKKPAISAWKDYQTTYLAEAKIKEAWGSSNHNIGIVTGEISKITVIDIDKGGVESLKEAGVNLPKTFTVKSPHGYHYYYQYNPVLKQGTGVLDGVDIRNDGGYIIAPPSVASQCDKEWCKLAPSEHSYTVARDMEFQEFLDIPEVFLKPAKVAGLGMPEVTKYPTWVSDALNISIEEALGRRNDLATRVAGYFRQKGLPADVILGILRPWQERLNTEANPYPEQELATTVNSVCTKFPVGQNTTYVGETVEKPLVSCDEYGLVNVMFPEIGIRIELWDTKKTGYKFDCMINIYSTQLNSRIVGPIHIDTQSASSRAAIRALATKRQTENWDSILQESGSEAQVAMNRLEKPIPLSLSKATMENKWLVDPLIHGSLPSLLVADGDTGKSTVALALGMSVATGYNVIPDADPTKFAPVLYYDWELNEAETRVRYQQIAKGAGLVLTPDMDLHYRRPTSSFADIVTQVREHVRETRAGLIIIDSLVAALNDDANSPEAARSFFNALATLKIPALIITHVSKTDSDSGRPFGSVFFWNLARNVWHVKKQQDIDSNEVLLGIHHLKGNTTNKRPSIGVQLTFEEDAILFSQTDLRETPEIASQTTINKIEQTLMNGALTVKEITERIIVPYNTVNSTLHRHEGKRIVKIVVPGGENKWGLKA